MAKGFKYYIEEEKIRAYMKVPDEEKLRWLEEMLEFNQIALDEKSKRIMEMLRKGEV